MSISRRYTPEWAPGESGNIGIDLSFVVPPGVGLTSGSLTVWTNNAVPAEVSDFTISPVTVQGRTIYATLSGGVEGRDYQLRWSAHDTDGHIWPRTALLLCAQTS